MKSPGIGTTGGEAQLEKQLVLQLKIDTSVVRQNLTLLNNCGDIRSRPTTTTGRRLGGSKTDRSKLAVRGASTLNGVVGLQLHGALDNGNDQVERLGVIEQRHIDIAAF